MAQSDDGLVQEATDFLVLESEGGMRNAEVDAGGVIIGYFAHYYYDRDDNPVPVGEGHTYVIVDGRIETGYHLRRRSAFADRLYEYVGVVLARAWARARRRKRPQSADDKPDPGSLSWQRQAQENEPDPLSEPEGDEAEKDDPFA